MPLLYIIIGLILILIIWLVRKIPKKEKKIEPQIGQLHDKEFTQQQLSKTRNIDPSHTNLIHLYVSDDNNQLLKTWNEIAKDFDPNIYDLRTISNKEVLDFWKVTIVPTIRSNYSKHRFHPDHYDEYIGNFDTDSIKKFISSK